MRKNDKRMIKINLNERMSCSDRDMHKGTNDT